MLEYTLIKRHRPRFNVRLHRRQELPVPGRHRRRRVAPGHGHAGQAQEGRSATSGPTATPTPSARRSTCCCARSRSAPARTTSSTATRSWASRACSSTSRSAPARASARSTTTTTTRSSHELLAFLEGDTDEVVARLESEMQPRRPRRWSSSWPPGSATGSPACARPSRSSRWWPTAPRTSTSSASHDDELEAAVQVFYVRKGRVMGRKGFIVDKVEDLTAGELVGRVLERLYFDDTPLGMPKQVLVPELPDDPRALRGVAQRAPGLDGADPRAAAGRQAGAAGDRHPERRRRRSPATGCKRASDHNSRARALNELQEHLGPAGRAAAHRVLRHEPHPGHRLRRARWW